MLLYLFENLPMNLSLNATIFSFELAPWMGQLHTGFLISRVQE